MKTSDWFQLETIFHSALELSDQERDVYLSKACGEDEELRREIESLIISLEEHSDFLERPAFSLGLKAMKGTAEQAVSLAGRQIGSYKIASKLGSGGMGDVYLAEDTKLNRRVAVKFLSNPFVDDVWAKKQLIREAQAAALLDHRNICVVHSIEEIKEFHFIVMQYVDGETLAQFLRNRSLAFKEALSIAEQIIGALSAAHSHGIIHRDIKPGNIMITPDRQVKVLDFGLAKNIQHKKRSEQGEENISHVSQNGLILGTVAYMSPEQLRSERLDYRSDIFSFGIVLYELLSGRNPFARESQAETISAILSETPRPLRDIAADVPRALSEIVQKCLDKDKEKRYQSIAELSLEISNFKDAWSVAPAPRKNFWSPNYVAASFLVLLVIAAALFFLLRPARKIQTVAVLPIANQSSQSGNDYLSDGLTESLIHKLSRLSLLKVKSSTFIKQYKGRQIDPRSVAAELQADAVLTGEIIQKGTDSFLSAKLIDASSGSELWRDEFPITDEKLLSIQDKLFSQIVLHLDSPSNETGRKPSQTDNPEAFKYYLLGQHYWSHRDKRENVEKAVENFTKATEIDPLYAQAWAGRADSYMLLSVITYGELTTNESAVLAKAAARRAIEIDNTLCEPYVSLGVVKLRYDWDWQGAENDFKRAIALNSDYAPAHYWYSRLLLLTGRFEEAMIEGGKAKELDPFSTTSEINIGQIFYAQQDFDRAAEIFLDILKKKPDNRAVQFALGFLYLNTNKIKEATEIFEKIYAGDKRVGAAGLGAAYGKAGRRDDAMQILSELDRMAKDRYIPPQEKAIIYLGLGDKDRAFEFLQKSCADRNAAFPFEVMRDSLLDDLRSDSRFRELLRCANF